MNKSILIKGLMILIAYLCLKYAFPFGRTFLYPVNLLVTFLHEFGHALAAIMTGGRVHAIQINMNGSGHTVTSGGIQAIILMGGYIGSAIFGNMLLYIGLKKPGIAKITMFTLAGFMVFTAFWWFNSLTTTIFLVIFAAALFFIANIPFRSAVLTFLGLASILHIIEDFNVGPSSDLQKYAEIFVVIPQFAWMYIWLFLVIALFGYNLKHILK